MRICLIYLSYNILVNCLLKRKVKFSEFHFTAYLYAGSGSRKVKAFLFLVRFWV